MIRQLRFRWVLLGLLAWMCAFARAVEPVTLRFTLWDGDQALVALRQAIDGFEKAHPNIKVKLEPVAYGDYFNKLLVQMAGNVAPDVAMLDPNNFQRFAIRKAILPLNAFVQDDKSFDINAYYEPIVKAMSYRGELYVLPRDIAPIGIVYYNKELFDRAGIPYPDGTWTWDYEERPELKEKDFLYVLRNLTKFDAKGKVTQYGLAAGWPAALGDSFVYSTGARYGDDPERPLTLGYNDPRTVKAYELLADLMLKKRYMPSPSELSVGLGSNSLQEFMRGRAAMHVSGIWDTPVIRETLVQGKPEFFEWDICAVPAYKDGTLWCPTGGAGYSIVSTTKHPQEAWELLKWMSGEPGMMAMAKAGIAQPAIRALALKEPWIPGPNTPKDQQYPANRIVTDQLVPHVVFPPTADYWTEITSLINAPLDQIWNGTLPPKEALAEAQNRAETR
ncbi:MAG: sugar ABC transporter substrate-binding protein, partial [Fimbriimonadaceae bacterium]|nr:sugar ABC transporter substrate-binding protein [Fimbriimonadaceae bacterium]